MKVIVKALDAPVRVITDVNTNDSVLQPGEGGEFEAGVIELRELGVEPNVPSAESLNKVD